jgi:hypothetical protein
VSERQVEREPANEPCDDPAAIHAFTTTQRLTDFLDARGRGNWKVSFVLRREDIVLAVADAHHNGAAMLCFDPATDGSGGKLVSLVELLAACDQM